MENGEFYQEKIKSDDYQLLYMYLFRVDRIGTLYRQLMKAWYNQSFDVRALLDFYAWSDEYFFFAEENIKKHVSVEEYKYLNESFAMRPGGHPPAAELSRARRIYQILESFGWKSGLTKLSEQVPLGKFGGIRSEYGFRPRLKEGKA